jgi:hypothetical protein
MSIRNLKLDIIIFNSFQPWRGKLFMAGVLAMTVKIKNTGLN